MTHHAHPEEVPPCQEAVAVPGSKEDEYGETGVYIGFGVHELPHPPSGS